MIGLGRFWTELRRRIEEQTASLESSAGKGRPADWPEYQRLVGKIDSLRWVLDEARNILGDEDDRPRKRTRPDDDTDEEP